MLKERIKKIYLYRQALWNMAVSGLKAKYSSSILGFSWAIINPLLLMLTITFVFSIIFKIGIKQFPLFALSGIFPWMFFSSALSEATVSILNQQNIMRQFDLPREIIPLSSILSNFLNFLIGWLVIYPIFLIFNPKIIVLLPFLIVVLLLNFFFISGLGLIFSAINIFIRDVSQLLNLLLMLWFWVTPVFYSVDMVPLSFRWIYKLNPLVPYIEYYREVTFQNNIPIPSKFAAVSLWAVFSLILGFLVFSRLEPKILKRI